jgi:2,5-diketo-D-gluconate reductase B
MQDSTVQGVAVPAVGLGTWQMNGEECRNAVTSGLKQGYRHIDTAQMYGNEDAVGAAVTESDVDRADVFVTTKLDRGNQSDDAVLGSVEQSLERLGLEYIDLLLIHTPSRSVPIEETIGAMNQLQEEGMVRYIGVSNFSVQQTREAVETSDTPILTNQVKYHPFHSQSDLLEYCIENDVLLTAYSPLARGDVVTDDTLTAIGEQYGKTASQVALRWLIQQPNVVPIPKASNGDHLTENIAVFDFELTDREIQRVFELQGGLLDRVRDKLGL